MRSLPPVDPDAEPIIDEIAAGEARARRRRRTLLVIARRGLDGVDVSDEDVRDAVQFAAELVVERQPKRLHPEALRCSGCEGTGSRFPSDGYVGACEVECRRCDGTGRDPGDSPRQAWTRDEIQRLAADVVAAALRVKKDAPNC